MVRLMMRNTNALLLMAALLLGLTTLTGCERAIAIPPNTAEPVVLQTYEVLPEYRDELRTMLRSALGTDDSSIGRVTTGPGGTLLVVATPRIQAGVAQILEMGFDAPPATAPVELTYWIVVGRATDPAAGKPSFSVVGGRKLPQLNPVLTEIVTAQGPTEFALLERIQLTSVSQERAQARGSFARVTQRTTRAGQQVVADLEIEMPGNGFQSRVMLDEGQFMVLGQSGYGGRSERAFPGASEGEALTLYYILAADLDS